MTNAQPGWYPDPSGDVTKLRYYDGTRWTDDYMVNPQQPQVQAQQTAYTPPVQQTTTVDATYAAVPAATLEPGAAYSMTETDRTLRLIAFILNLISTIACCWMLIPLAWMIPMTVRSWGIYKGTKPNTVAFGVLTLIFVDLVSGVLLLCSKKDA